jgi:uncharacterized repeat protein (TIGR02543 family)
MADVKVSFHNDDGTPIVPDRTIKWGEAPQYPRPNPTKKGHNFTGWTVREGTPITADTVISATFTPIIYDVLFFDTNGRQIDGVQRIAYSQPADVPPVRLFRPSTPSSDGISARKAKARILQPLTAI